MTLELKVSSESSVRCAFLLPNGLPTSFASSENSTVFADGSSMTLTGAVLKSALSLWFFFLACANPVPHINRATRTAMTSARRLGAASISPSPSSPKRRPDFGLMLTLQRQQLRPLLALLSLLLAVLVLALRKGGRALAGG